VTPIIQQSFTAIGDWESGDFALQSSKATNIKRETWSLCGLKNEKRKQDDSKA